MIPLASAAGGAAASVFQDLLDGARKRMRRVVVTGVGVVAPNGIGKDAFWSACLNGRSGVGPIRSSTASRNPWKLPAEVPDSDAPPSFNPGKPKNAGTISRPIRSAAAAAGLPGQDG